MKWILLCITILFLTGCNEKNVIQNENSNKVEERKQENVNRVEMTTPDSATMVGLYENIKTDSSSNNVSIEQQIVKNESSIIVTEESNISVIEEGEQLMEQITSLEQEIMELLETEKIETMKEKIVDKFITLVDFIYYEQPIGNVYFKDLTTSLQEKVCSILTRMDGVIESKIPNYKNTLKEKYQLALSYLKKQASSLSEKIEEKIGSDNYQNFIEGKNDLVESFQNTAEIIQEGASKVYEEGKEKVSNWYQDLKEKYQK